MMRAPKKGPHKCFKTLTERLTTKYVCPSKGKGAVAALSTMSVRPERAEQLEKEGEVRKPPKQERERLLDPIARLDAKEKAREARHLSRMASRPESMHADEEKEATAKTPDTVHYEVDEEAEAVKKSFSNAIDIIETGIVERVIGSSFSSVSKSLFSLDHLNKARMPDPKDPEDKIYSKWTSKLPFATTVEDFKEKFRNEHDESPPPDFIEEFKSEFKKITGYEPTPKAKEAHFKELKSKMFTVGPPQDPTTEIVRHTGNKAIPDPMQTPARYGGSEKQRMIKPGEMYTKPIIKDRPGSKKDKLLTDAQGLKIKQIDAHRKRVGIGAAPWHHDMEAKRAATMAEIAFWVVPIGVMGKGLVEAGLITSEVAAKLVGRSAFAMNKLSPGAKKAMAELITKAPSSVKDKIVRFALVTALTTPSAGKAVKQYRALSQLKNAGEVSAFVDKAAKTSSTLDRVLKIAKVSEKPVKAAKTAKTAAPVIEGARRGEEVRRVASAAGKVPTGAVVSPLKAAKEEKKPVKHKAEKKKAPAPAEAPELAPIKAIALRPARSEDEQKQMQQQVARGKGEEAGGPLGKRSAKTKGKKGKRVIKRDEKKKTSPRKRRRIGGRRPIRCRGSTSLWKGKRKKRNCGSHTSI